MNRKEIPFVVLGVILLVGVCFVFGTSKLTTTATTTVRPVDTITPEVTVRSTATESPILNFTGRLLVEIEHDIYELSINKLTSKVEWTLIAPSAGVGESISPDGSYLLYINFEFDVSELRLYDFRNGETRTITKGDFGCVSWSPDSTKFSANIDDELIVFDLSDNSTHVIYEPPSAVYSVGGIGPGELRIGYFGCGLWLEPDSFIFQRTSKMTNNLKDLDKDTTTLALLKPSFTLEDFPQRIFVMDVCMNDNLIIVSKTAESNVLQSNFFLTQAFRDFKSVDLHSLDFESSGKIGFLPGANCEIYFEYSESSGNSNETMHFVFLDPNNQAQRLEYEVRGARLIRWDGVWVGEPEDRVIAFHENIKAAIECSNPGYISTLNLITGEKTNLAKTTDCVRVLGWLP